MEVGSQTDPMDPTDILNLLRQREKEQETRNKSPVFGVVGEDEIQTVEIIDGEVFFNSHNEPEFGKNGQSGGKSLFTKSKSHPAAEPSLTDKICEVVWSRKESIHGVAGGSSGNSWKSKRLGRSHSFKGSSSSSANLSPTKLCTVDPYSRRASGSSSIIRTAMSGTSTSTTRSREFLPPPSSTSSTSPNFFDPTKVRRSHGDADLRRQISGVLSIPSRQDSCKSTSSNKSEMEAGRNSNSIALRPRKSDVYLVGNNETRSNKDLQGCRLSLTRDLSSKSLNPGGSLPSTSARASRSNSVALSHLSGTNHPYADQIRSAANNDNPRDIKKQRKYIIAGFSCILVVAIACIIISLSIAPHIDSQGNWQIKLIV